MFHRPPVPAMNEIARFAAMMHKSADLKRRIAGELAAAVIGVVDACETSLRGGGKLMFCGNGGSAADSQHLATEMLVRLRGSVERPSIAALALTLDPAMLTAGGNDYGYDMVFERPLRGLGRRGDVLFGITTSGRSPNVVRALAAAREMGIVTVGLLGGQGSRRWRSATTCCWCPTTRRRGSRSATSRSATRCWSCWRIGWSRGRSRPAIEPGPGKDQTRRPAHGDPADRRGRVHRLPRGRGAAGARRAGHRRRQPERLLRPAAEAGAARPAGAAARASRSIAWMFRTAPRSAVSFVITKK